MSCFARRFYRLTPTSHIGGCRFCSESASTATQQAGSCALFPAVPCYLQGAQLAGRSAGAPPVRGRTNCRRAFATAPRRQGADANFAQGAFSWGCVSGARSALYVRLSGDTACCAIARKPFLALRFQRLLHRLSASLRAMQETLSRLRRNPTRSLPPAGRALVGVLARCLLYAIAAGAVALPLIRPTLGF